MNAESIVKANCISCHGDTLDGRGAANKNLQKVGAKLSKDQIANQINNGGNGMPGFKGKLKPEEVTAVADWLAAKK
ncbi:cytochrome c [Paenibacillus cremeus]|uniref:Cytochrome c n=1 Tax=Paenibacillus cremeus TaxID=2163881 RepID=A0A559KFG2_9BACL|nr:cytochrome c [Paenibacillus cremeus]